METLYFYILGLIQFRSDVTTNPGVYIEAYDKGRDLAHALTLRRFEST